MVIKPLGNTININSVANSVFNSTLVKVVNSGTYATLVCKYANTVQYADIPMGQNESIIIQKNSSDIIIGSNMYAAPIAWPKG